MAGLDPAIHVLPRDTKNVDARDKPGHDVVLGNMAKAQSCPSSVSPPETSTLPGIASRFSFFTTPSSTSIE
ncbi:MAG: hypothetical protein EKK33_31380 [Bradyrhizobiaceae bacterium]|nr:MAG: hypothetical protein EKK33_31380 [Bradyrhizobiaceae bacterium]